MPTPLSVRAALWLWLIAALVAGQLELPARLPVPATLALFFGLTGLVLVIYFQVGVLRRWVDSLDLRALVFLHVTRFVGIYFLLLYGRGELPSAFALPAGWGEIVVAALALPVSLVPMGIVHRRHAVAIWNTVGLVGLVSVTATAAQLGLADRGQMQAFTSLPLCLLPTFLGPLLLATHVIIFVRLSRNAPRPLS